MNNINNKMHCDSSYLYANKARLSRTVTRRAGALPHAIYRAPDLLNAAIGGIICNLTIHNNWSSLLANLDSFKTNGRWRHWNTVWLIRGVWTDAFYRRQRILMSWLSSDQPTAGKNRLLRFYRNFRAIFRRPVRSSATRWRSCRHPMSMYTYMRIL